MASRGSEDGAEVIIGLFRSPGLAQGHCETNSAPGLSPFLLLFPHLFPPSSISPPPSFAHPFLLLGSIVTVDQSTGESQRSEGANSV